MSLKKYIEQKNIMRELFNEAPITLPLNQDQINELAEEIDCDLSPENLCCDGEISASEANRKYIRLHKAFDELKKHAEEQGLAITAETYEV